MRLGTISLAAVLALGASLAAAETDNDPYLWLSDIQGAKALEWVKGQNEKSEAALRQDPDYQRDYDAMLKVLNANDRIPEPDVVDHQWVFNFWQDADHVRGVWRRTTVADYANANPNWQVLLDVDKYDHDTGKNWVWQGADCTPSFGRCLVALSPGGTDAHEVHEFDPKAGKFLDDGFSLAQAKSEARYIDDNTILFATDFGPGTVTPSSYPRIVKLWHRGEPISAAKTVYEAKADDIGANASVFHGPYGTIPLIIRRITFFTANFFFVKPDGSTVQLPIPDSAEIKGVTQGQLILTLRDDWTPQGQKKIGKGSLVAFPVLDFANSGKAPKIAVLYTPGPHAMIAQDVSAGRDAVYAPIYVNVIGSIHEFKPANGKWSDTTLRMPANGSTGVVSANDWGPEAYVTFQSFTQPPTLYEYDGSSPAQRGRGTMRGMVEGAEAPAPLGASRHSPRKRGENQADLNPRAIKSEPERFDPNIVSVTQHWVASRDGTKVPYFLIRPKNAKGAIPTILYSYGGYELSLNPWYWNDGHRPIYPAVPWFSKGGAIAVANIRGGGEFGPSWHQAALKEHRQRAFDDFAAVGQDLVERGLTTPKQLGIVGASNGGVLTTVTMTQHPDLLNAVVVQRPLIDMLRYTEFGAGASWTEEYGDPANPKDRAYLAKYSAYQNVKPNVKYPPVLFITETTDDRVTPVWARMMAAKMEDQRHDVLFYESAEGGHGAGVTHAQEAEYWALSYTFFKQKLGLGASGQATGGSAHAAPK